MAPLRDATIPDLEGLLGPGDLLVVNETRVIPARLEAIREETGGKAEVLLLEHGEGSIRLMLGTRGKPSSGEAIVVADGALSLVLEENEGEGVWRARTAASSEELRNAMERHGHVPLPPYIRREHGRSAPPHGPSGRRLDGTARARCWSPHGQGYPD